MVDWNAIFDPKIDRVGRGARGPGRCETSLIDLMARHDLVDRFYLDHPDTRYKHITGAKISFDKSEGSRLCA